MLKLLILYLISISLFYAQSSTMKIFLHTGEVLSIQVKDIQKITFSEASSINKNDGSILHLFKLLQNFPNPFNSSTTISYILPSQGTAKIHIFNLEGQLVRSFDRYSPNKGLNSIVWDMRDNNRQPVSSGIYFFEVIFQNIRQTRKMLLIK